MKLWSESAKMSDEEREQRIREHRRNIVPSNSFYVRGKTPPYTNDIGSPENRRAAGVSVRKS